MKALDPGVGAVLERLARESFFAMREEARRRAKIDNGFRKCFRCHVAVPVEVTYVIHYPGHSRRVCPACYHRIYQHRSGIRQGGE
jgi:uncharacterized paraquat-inducible protein A